MTNKMIFQSVSMYVQKINRISSYTCLSHTKHTFRIQIKTIEWSRASKWDRERNSKLSKPSWGQYKTTTKEQSRVHVICNSVWTWLWGKATHLRSYNFVVVFGRWRWCECSWSYGLHFFSTEGKYGISFGSFVNNNNTASYIRAMKQTNKREMKRFSLSIYLRKYENILINVSPFANKMISAQ